MSIRKEVIFLRVPRVPVSSPEAANRITKSERSAWLMKCLVPLMTKSPPDSTAEVFMPRRSDPAPGSVIARHSARSPRTAGRR